MRSLRCLHYSCFTSGDDHHNHNDEAPDEAGPGGEASSRLGDVMTDREQKILASIADPRKELIFLLERMRREVDEGVANQITLSVADTILLLYYLYFLAS